MNSKQVMGVKAQIKCLVSWGIDGISFLRVKTQEKRKILKIKPVLE